MAFNNGFPVTYPQMTYPYGYQPSAYQPATTVPQNVQTNGGGTPAQREPAQVGNDSGILWVQGEAGAKSFPVAPGKSVMLMDSESQTFYIKSADVSGMPLPLRAFDYSERFASAEPVVAPGADYVTREELEARLAELLSDKKQKKEAK